MWVSLHLGIGLLFCFFFPSSLETRLEHEQMVVGTVIRITSALLGKIRGTGINDFIKNQQMKYDAMRKIKRHYPFFLTPDKSMTLIVELLNLHSVLRNHSSQQKHPSL